MADMLNGDGLGSLVHGVSDSIVTRSSAIEDFNPGQLDAVVWKRIRLQAVSARYDARGYVPWQRSEVLLDGRLVGDP
jgi:hypothetical protein